jgi:hypothetical protein
LFKKESDNQRLILNKFRKDISIVVNSFRRYGVLKLLYYDEKSKILFGHSFITKNYLISIGKKNQQLKQIVRALLKNPRDTNNLTKFVNNINELFKTFEFALLETYSLARRERPYFLLDTNSGNKKSFLVTREEREDEPFLEVKQVIGHTSGEPDNKYLIYIDEDYTSRYKNFCYKLHKMQQHNQAKDFGYEVVFYNIPKKHKLERHCFMMPSNYKRSRVNFRGRGFFKDILDKKIERTLGFVEYIREKIEKLIENEELRIFQEIGKEKGWEIEGIKENETADILTIEEKGEIKVYITKSMLKMYKKYADMLGLKEDDRKELAKQILKSEELELEEYKRLIEEYKKENNGEKPDKITKKRFAKLALEHATNNAGKLQKGLHKLIEDMEYLQNIKNIETREQASEIWKRLEKIKIELKKIRKEITYKEILEKFKRLKKEYEKYQINMKEKEVFVSVKGNDSIIKELEMKGLLKNGKIKKGYKVILTGSPKKEIRESMIEIMDISREKGSIVWIMGEEVKDMFKDKIDLSKKFVEEGYGVLAYKSMITGKLYMSGYLGKKELRKLKLIMKKIDKNKIMLEERDIEYILNLLLMWKFREDFSNNRLKELWEEIVLGMLDNRNEEGWEEIRKLNPNIRQVMLQPKKEIKERVLVTRVREDEEMPNYEGIELKKELNMLSQGSIRKEVIQGEEGIILERDIEVKEKVEKILGIELKKGPVIKKIELERDKVEEVMLYVKVVLNLGIKRFLRVESLIDRVINKNKDKKYFEGCKALASAA